MKLFKNFKRPARLAPAPETVMSGSGIPQLALGEIKLIRGLPSAKYRADVRLFSGTIIAGVRLPGPAYTAAGFMHGLKSAYEVGQLVLVAFPNNSAANAIVAAAFPHPGGDLSKTNLASSIDADLFSDIEIAHRSGYKIKFTDDTIILYTGGQATPVAVFNASAGTLTLTGITITTDGPVLINNTLTVLNDLTVSAGAVIITAGALTMAAASISAAGVLDAANAILNGVLNVLTHRHVYTDDGAPLNTEQPF